MTILITGGTGMLGRSVKKLLPDAIAIGSSDCNLCNREAVCDLFQKIKPTAVVHLAGRIGGIKDNSEFPYDYYRDNIYINTNVVDCCLKFKVPKLVAMSSTCVYPKNPPGFPMTEDMINEGKPEITNFAYAHAKRAMSAQIEAARIQHEARWCVLYSSNLYGPHDHFEIQRSHVISALMYKMHKAKEEKNPKIELFGSGEPLRQFTYVEDMANMIVIALDEHIDGDFNFCHEKNYSIAEAAETIAETVGYSGILEWNHQLDGVMRKDATCDKIRNYLHFACNAPKIPPTTTSLKDGVSKTYGWYCKNLLRTV